MSDKKITQLTNITGANLVDADEFVVVDISADETKAITLGELKEAFDSGSGFVRITGDTMTGDLALSGADVTFGDNDKAIFGAGSDLQIYHDGSNNRIVDSGTGSLYIQGQQAIILANADATEFYATFDVNGASTLRYDNSQKLATTSTGIDVTGTVTADGLTVDGDTLIGSIYTNNYKLGVVTPSASSTIQKAAQFSDYLTTDLNIMLDNGEVGLFAGNGNGISIGNNNATDRLKIANNGDLSLYDSTGTTPKFFWDASAESLGIGTSSPSYPVTIHKTGDGIKFEVSDTVDANYRIQVSGNDIITGPSTASDYIFQTGNSERMRLDASGIVLVGKTSASKDTVGAELKPDGRINATMTSGSPILANRQTTDGDIAVFQKDNATVGSIGAYSGDMTLGTVDTGLKFYDAGNTIQPRNPSTGAGRDASIDLGDQYNRFKDLYLSGGVYLGGTGAANKLDDYEEGTFGASLDGASGGSITLKTASNTLSYIKIGSLVHIQGRIDVDSVSSPTGSIKLSLPFGAANPAEGSGESVGSVFVFGLASAVTTGFTIRCDKATSNAYIEAYDGTTNQVDATDVQANTGFRIGFSYRTNA